MGRAGGVADGAAGLLAVVMPAAVALRIAELLDMPPTARTRVAARWAARAVDPLASSADMLMRRDPAGRRHTADCVRERRTACDCLTGTAEVFNHAARGLAALALGPSGVTWGGLHWCAVHPAGLRCDDEDALDCAHVSGHGQALPVETVRLAGGVL